MQDYFQTIRQLTSIPVAVGFGISQRADIDYLKEQKRAEVAVMGTAILKTYLESGKKGLADFLSQVVPAN